MQNDRSILRKSTAELGKTPPPEIIGWGYRNYLTSQLLSSYDNGDNFINAVENRLQ
jgi:hypothetical protein